MVYTFVQNFYFMNSTTERFCLQLKRFISTIDVNEILHDLFIKNYTFLVCKKFIKNNYFLLSIKKVVKHKNFTRLTFLDDEKY